MALFRSQLTTMARSYVGAPYLHQGRDRRYGVDCVGLLVCVARDLKLTDFDLLGYSRSPDGSTLQAILDQHLVRLASPEMACAGDVLALKYGAALQHTAFLSARRGSTITVIHAVNGRGVVEHLLDERWLSTRRAVIFAGYQFPGITE